MDMRIKKSCLGMLAACGVLFGAARADAEVSVTDVTAVPRYPWNGLVDIQCTVSGSGGLNGWFEFAVAAVDAESGSVRDVTHFHVVRDGADADDKEVRSDGEHKLLWDARADLGEVVVDNMVVRVTVRTRDKEGHTGVQLWEGGPYWAETNLGADHPWEYGLYFWWGDTVGYKRENNAWVASNGAYSNFKFDPSNPIIQTYGNRALLSEGWIVVSEGNVLASEHDAAQVQWGGGWRMPTYQELQDLCDKCDWEWTTLNGVNGGVVHGRGEFAKTSIFISNAGHGSLSSLVDDGSGGSLWSATPYSSRRYSGTLNFLSDLYVTYSYNLRYYGQSVRSVRGATE